jgi:hypothetical protein
MKTLQKFALSFGVVAVSFVAGSLISQAMVGSAKQSAQQQIATVQAAADQQVAEASQKLAMAKQKLIFAPVEADFQSRLDEQSSNFATMGCNLPAGYCNHPKIVASMQEEATAFKQFALNSTPQLRGQVAENFCNSLAAYKRGERPNWFSHVPNWRNFYYESNSASYFDKVEGYFDLRNSKPNPSMYLSAIMAVSAENTGLCEKLAQLQ